MSRFIYKIFFAVILCGYSMNSKAQPAFRIAAASDLKFALDSLIEKFRGDHRGEILVTYGSSGKLAEQILNGAPFDVFFSADLSYPRKLQKNGLTVSEVELYAIGRIVIWSKTMDPSELKVNTLLDEKIKKISIANPMHAPYGKRAEEALKYYKVYNQVNHKLVFGENISQAAQFVYSGAAQAGIIALSIALSPPMQKENGKYYILPEESHNRLEQGYVVLKNGAKKKMVLEFAEFLKSSGAQAILEYYGFNPYANSNLK
jgi:molybdate transport system substrate-binding protein